jgi:hypothetical protein
MQPDSHHLPDGDDQIPLAATTSVTPISVARRINREGELRLPRDRGRAAAVPSLDLGSVRHVRPCWWETEYGRWRLRLEAEAMRRHFPGFRLLENDRALHWLGKLTAALADATARQSSRTFLVRVAYPALFPYDAPSVVIERPALPADTPHLVAPNEPCLYHPDDGPRSGYDRARTTAATLISWTSMWLHALEVWNRSGEWPGAEL